MRSVAKIAGVIILLLALLGACTALPNTTGPTSTPEVATSAPAATVAPGSTEGPGSTEAPPPPASSEGGSATSVPSAEGAVTTSPETVAPEAAATSAPTSAPAPAATPAFVATTVPEPTMPPAPTAPVAGGDTLTVVAPAATCTPGALTPEQTEGPYYKTNPPESATLLQPGMGGTKLTVTGYVLDAQCNPVPGARVDFWQADSEGQYDNQGYTLRGYQVTDAAGRYSVETVVPGLYPGRTRHIHVKITPPGGPALTTQLYFPDEVANAQDQIFSPALIMKVAKAADREVGTFNFVVKTQ